MRAGWLFIATSAISLSLAPAAFAQRRACEPLTPLDVVVVSPNVPKDECHHNVRRVFERFAAYSWQLFISLNWPAASGARGEPDGNDPTKIADRTAPRVWETWKSVQETFIPGGREPAEWDVPETHAVCRNSSELEPQPTKVLADLNQSGFQGRAIGPLIARNRTYVRYEIRMNKIGFEEITAKQLYLRDRLPAVNRNKAFTLPNGMINVKAAWREVRPGENTDRYYRTDALAFDPSTGRCDKRSFVLIGLHIVQKTGRRPQWTWSTFEHVDNIAIEPDAPSGTTPSLLAGKIPGAAPHPVDATHPPLKDPKPVQVVVPPEGNPRPRIEVVTNAKWQRSPELRDTIWRFYKLIRIQWPVEPSRPPLGSPDPERHAANATMETYFQQVTCMGCHLRTSRRTDFSWFISLRAHPIDQKVPSNARTFSDTVLNFSDPWREPPR